jgi:hypothetical protein
MAPAPLSVRSITGNEFHLPNMKLDKKDYEAIEIGEQEQQTVSHYRVPGIAAQEG